MFDLNNSNQAGPSSKIDEQKKETTITYEYIYNRIYNNLLSDSNESITGSVDNYIPTESFKNKIISFILNYGFKHKEKIKKVYFLDKIARRFKTYLNNSREYSVTKQSLVLEDLLKYDYVDFVTYLYRKILLREPDGRGLNHYLGLLNQGVPKELIVYKIYNSNEAKRLSPIIGGIDKYRKSFMKLKIKQAVKKSPLIWIYRVIMFPITINKLHQDFSMFIYGQEYKQRLYEHKLERELEKQINELKSIQQIQKDQAVFISNHQKDILKLFQNLKVQNNNLVNLSTTGVENFEIIKKQQEKVKEELVQRFKCQERDIKLSFEQLLEAQQNKAQYINNYMGEISEKLELITNSKRAISSGEIVVIEVDEFLVGVPTNEWRMASYMAFRGHLEPGLTKFFRSFVKEGMVVVDIGANIGIYTLIAASLVGSIGKVYSFEPTPTTFSILKNNIQLNGFLETNRVHMQQLAITDTIGTANFAVYENNSGHNTLFPKNRSDNLIEVKTSTLDNLIDSSTNVDLVKIDVEGSEAFALNGMKETIRRNKDIAIIMEFAPSHLKRSGVELNLFVSDLADKYYVKLIDAFSGEILDVTTDELLNTFSMNILLKRKN